MGEIDPRAVEKVAGKAWDGLRESFDKICGALLRVSPDARSELTTIYVKFCTSQNMSAPAYAVLWLKSSKRLVVGFALPLGAEAKGLVEAPAGMRYKGLTKYLIVEPGEDVPQEIGDWALVAFNCAVSRDE